MPFRQPYRTERWIRYAHRVSAICAAGFALVGVIILPLAILTPWARVERVWFAVILLAVAATHFLFAWLLRQAQLRHW